MNDQLKSGNPDGNPGDPQDLKFEGHLADVPQDLQDKLKDMTPEDREKLTGWMENKSKNWQSIATKEKEAVKLREQELAITLKQQNELIAKMDQVKSQPTQEKQGKLLDRLISSASDPEQRETLSQLRQAIVEETSDVRDLINQQTEANSKLQEELSYLKSVGEISLSSKIKSDLNQLSDKFGSELTSKYSAQFEEMALKYPNTDSETVLKYVTPMDELVKAVNAQELVRQKKESDRRMRSLEPTSSSSVSPETERQKNKAGRIIDTASRAMTRIREEGLSK